MYTKHTYSLQVVDEAKMLFVTNPLFHPSNNSSPLDANTVHTSRTTNNHRHNHNKSTTDVDHQQQLQLLKGPQSPLNKESVATTHALHQSILDGRLKQLSYFLKLGYKVDVKDKYGRTCMMLACLCDHESYGVQVAKLLLKYGANLNTTDTLGRTCLYLACSERRSKLFHHLIDTYGDFVDLLIRDNDGNILLNHVAIHGDTHMLRKVIKRMHDHHMDLDNRNAAGYSALLLAIKNDRYFNAYELAKEVKTSPAIKDYEMFSNALEWLIARVKANAYRQQRRNFAMMASAPTTTTNQSLQAVITDGAESTHSLDQPVSASSSNQRPGDESERKRRRFKLASNWSTESSLTARRQIKMLQHTYKTWYKSHDQYNEEPGGCEHVNPTNHAVEHHKSRYMPSIFMPRKNSITGSSSDYHYEPLEREASKASSDINSASTYGSGAAANARRTTMEPATAASDRSANNKTPVNGDEARCATASVKAIIQKLYETLLKKMSEASKRTLVPVMTVSQSLHNAMPIEATHNNNNNNHNTNSSNSSKQAKPERRRVSIAVGSRVNMESRKSIVDLTSHLNNATLPASLVIHAGVGNTSAAAASTFVATAPPSLPVVHHKPHVAPQPHQQQQQQQQHPVTPQTHTVALPLEPIESSGAYPAVSLTAKAKRFNSLHELDRYKFDTNIFNMEAMRQTPKLLALQSHFNANQNIINPNSNNNNNNNSNPTENSPGRDNSQSTTARTSCKEFIHNLCNMYEMSSLYQSSLTSNNNGGNIAGPIELAKAMEKRMSLDKIEKSYLPKLSIVSKESKKFAGRAK